MDNIEGELKHLRSVQKMNGYAKKFIDNAMKTRQHVREKTKYQSSVSLPYSGSVNFIKPVVCRIPCDCGLMYIGEAGRNLSLRLKKHKP